MTSAGSVSISLELDRSGFDKDIRSLENLKLEPLNLDIKLNASNLQRQIRDLTKDLDCIPLDLCVHINERRLKAEVEKVKEYLTQELQLTVRAAVNASVKVESGAKDKSQSSTNSSAVEAANQKLEASFQKVGDKLNAAIEKSLNSAFSAALSPFKGVARGFFEGIGQTFSKQLAKGAIASFQKELGVNFKGTGSNIGKSAGKTTNEILGRSGKGGDSSAGGNVRQSPKKPSPGAGDLASPLEKELKNIEDTLRSVNKAFTQAGGGIGSLGKSTTKAAEDALKLAGALVQLYGVVTTTKNTSNPQTLKPSGDQKATESQSSSTKSSSSQESKKSAPHNSSAPTIEQTQNRPIRGFLKGDRASLTKEEAKNQVEAVRSQLEKQLKNLQATPQTEQTRKRIAALSKAIATIEARIASDIASSDIPKAVRQSLGQLKGASSKLAQTKRAIEAEAQKAARPIPSSSKGAIALAAEAQKKITDSGLKIEATLKTNRKLPGVIKGAAGAAAGASILGAGGAFAAPGASVGGLGFLGALPFDPTLGLAAGGLAASFFAAKKLPSLLRRAGFEKTANVLATDVGRLAIDSVSGTIKQLFKAREAVAGREPPGFIRRDRKQGAAVAAHKLKPSLLALRFPQGSIAATGGNLESSPAGGPDPSSQSAPPAAPPAQAKKALQAFAQNMRLLTGWKPRLILGPNSGENIESNLLDASGKPLGGSSQPLPLLDSKGKPVKEVKVQSPQLLDQNGKPLGGTTQPLPLLDSKGKPVKEVKVQPPQLVDKNGKPIGKDTPALRAFAENMRGLALQKPTATPQPQSQPQPPKPQPLTKPPEARIDTPAMRAFAENMRGLVGQKPQARPPIPPLPPPPPPPKPQPQVQQGARPPIPPLPPPPKPQPQPQPQPKPRPPIPPLPPPPKPQPQPRPPLPPPPKPQPLPPLPPVPGNYWERFFRGLEARFYRSPLFSGNVSPKDRRSLTSEAAGFVFSGAALVAPGTTLAALLVPLATALTPLITTVGLVTSALAPLVGVIGTTLKQIEPLQARLLYVSGSESGALENRNFVQGVAEQFNISSFASLEQFSKLSAAVKGTRLQGEPLRDLFKGIAVASKALALDTQDLNLVMFAFTQIASKGKLSAEEVRLQLADRFPGIINILAKALGLTVIEFNRMLESGQLLAADVLPKLGKALQREYGAAAEAASGNFLSAITKVENAIFRLKEGVARSLAPIFTGVANTIGSSLNLIASNAEKLVPIFSVVLIGVAAQFFVGLTQILEASGIIGKMQAFLIPLFSRLFVTLTPFMIGIVADFLDDILGAQTSVMENMMKGVYNLVLGTILVVVDLGKAISNLTSTIGKNDSRASKSNVFGQIFDSLKNITKIIPSTIVEFASLSLILAQTYVLASQGLNLVLARFGTTVTALGASFVASARSGRLFGTALNTLTAGLTGSQLAATAATAAFLLFFAKADFTNELGSDFDKLAESMSGSLERISKALDKTGNDLDKLPEKVSKLKSQGFDLTLGLGEVFGLGGAFRTDDLINLANKETEKFYRDQRDKGLITEEEYRRNTSRPLRTLADKQFDDNKFKLDGLASSYFQVLDKSGLLNGQFKNGEAGKALDEVKAIDKQIGELQKARVILLGDNVVISDNTKKEIATLDAQIQALLDRRGEIKKPIEEVRTEVLASADTLKSVLDAINNAAIPEDKKQELRSIIQPVLDIANQAKTKLQELGAIDLSPLGNSFADVVKQAEALNKTLDKNKNRLTLDNLKEQTSIQSQLANGDIDRNNADRQTLEQEIANLRNNAQDLESFVQERRKQLFELLAVPQPTPEQQDTITKYQSELTAKEVEFQQTQLSIAQKLVEARAKEIEKRLRQLDAAIKASEAALDGTNTEKVLRIKLSQTSAPVTEVGEALFDRLYGEQRVDEIDGRIGITRKKIADLDRNNFESEEKFIEAKAALQVELGNLIKQKIDERLNLERKLQEEVLRNIRQRTELEVASLDRTKQLLESRRNLEKALSDADLAPGESQIQALDLALDVRRKLDEATDSKTKSKLNELLGRLGASGDELSILQAKQRLEDDIAQKKLKALEQEQKYELELLGIDHRRQRLAQEQAVAEADIANQRALIATLNANKDLQEAKKSGDQDTIILAEKLLYINRQILDATAKQLDNANKNLEAQDEAASSAIAALDAQQQAARNSAQAAETLRNVQQDLTLLEVTNNRKGTDNNKESTTSGERSPSQSKPYQFKSMLEASRFHLFGILPGESNLSASLRQQFGIGNKKLSEEQQGLLDSPHGSLLLPGRGKNTSVIQRLGRANSSDSRNNESSTSTGLKQPDSTGKGTPQKNNLDESAEAYTNRLKGLDPFESAEDYFNRSVGLQPGESTEDYLKRPRSSYFGAQREGSLEDLSLKYKPRYSNFEDLQQKHKPVAESFEELNQKYPNNTPGFNSFTDGLKEANKGIEQRLDALNEKMGQAMASPRNLYVQSASPVSDAAQIWGNIARGMTTAAGLG